MQLFLIALKLLECAISAHYAPYGHSVSHITLNMANCFILFCRGDIVYNGNSLEAKLAKRRQIFFSKFIHLP